MFKISTNKIKLSVIFPSKEPYKWETYNHKKFWGIETRKSYYPNTLQGGGHRYNVYINWFKIFNKWLFIRKEVKI